MSRRATHITSRRETRRARATARARIVHAGLAILCLAMVSVEFWWALEILSATGQ